MTEDRKNKKISRLKTPFLPVLLISVLCLLIHDLTGCTNVKDYLGFWRKQRLLKAEFKEEPSAHILRELRPEDAFLLVGRVSVNKEYNGPILVAAVTDRFRKQEIVVAKTLQAPVQFYHVYLPEGAYDLYFFVDTDENGFFDDSEMIGRTSGRPITVTRTVVTDGLTCQGPEISLDLNNPAKSDLTISVAVKDQPYAFESLDDEFFDKKIW